MITILEVLNKRLKYRISSEIQKYNEDIRKKENNYYILGDNINDRTYWLVQLFSNYFYTNNMHKPTTEMRKRLKCSYADGYGKKEAKEIHDYWIKDGGKFKAFSKGLSDDEKNAVLDDLRNNNISINDIDEIPDLLFNRLDKIIASFPKEKKTSKKDTSQNYKFITQPPVRPSNVFEGREDDISKILKLSESDKIALVNGIGGIGKTSICRYIFWDIADNGSEDTTTLAWIAYNKSLILSFYLAFEGINADNPDNYYLQAQNMINQYGTKLLLFIDNANDISDEEIQKIRKFSCKVIITSRSKLDSIETYFVDHLNEDTCILIYKKYSGDSKDESNEYIKKIVKLADYHTITIELIAKIQKANHKNAKQMLDTLREKGFNLENITSKVSADNGSDKAKFNEHMAKLFDISNITDEEEIRELGLFSLLKPNAHFDFDTISQLFKKSEDDDTDFDFEPINELFRKGWLSVTEGNEKVFMHPVISDVVRQLLSPQFDDFKDLIVALNKLLNKEDTDFLIMHILHDTSVSILGYLHNIDVNLDIIYSIYKKLPQSRYEKILLGIYNEALPDFENEYGTEHFMTATLYHQIGDIYFSQRNYEKALEFLHKALPYFENKYGTKHSNTATLYSDIGIAYLLKMNFEKALDFFHNALSYFENEYGTKYSMTAILYYAIGNTYFSQKDFKKALEFFHKALPYYKNKYGTKHSKTAILYSYIGNAYLFKMNFEKALDFFHNALSYFENEYGTEHFITATLYSDIGNTYFSQKDFKKALEFFHKALPGFENRYGTEHSKTATLYYDIGNAYFSQRNFEKALEFFHKAHKDPP